MGAAQEDPLFRLWNEAINILAVGSINHLWPFLLNFSPKHKMERHLLVHTKGISEQQTLNYFNVYCWENCRRKMYVQQMHSERSYIKEAFWPILRDILSFCLFLSHCSLWTSYSILISTSSGSPSHHGLLVTFINYMTCMCTLSSNWLSQNLRSGWERTWNL